MIEDRGIRFSGEEFMELWRSSIELEANYNSLKRRYETLENALIRLQYRVDKLEESSDTDLSLFEPKEDI